jgi:hypothetical protein
MLNERRWLLERSEAPIYAAFALLLVFATYPIWRLLVFGLTVDDLLQLRCASLLW